MSSALIKRPYPQIWLAQTVNYFGDQIYAVALPWLVYDQTHSGTAMALCFSAGMLPYVVFGVMGGASADRGQRRHALLGGNAFAAVAVAIMCVAGLLRVRAPHGWDIILLAFALASATSYAGSAAESAVPLIFSQESLLRRANSYIEFSNSASQVLGPALAGLLIAILSAPGALAIDAASFVFAFAVFASLGPSTGLPVKDSEIKISQISCRLMLDQFLNGILYVLKNRILRSGMMLSVCNNLVLGGVDTLLILILRSRDGLSAEGTSIVLALGGLGAVAAAGVVLPNMKIQLPGRIMIGAVVVCGIAAAMIGVIRSTALDAVFVLLFGAASTTYNVVWRTLRQQVADRTMLGRVAGACRGIAYCGAALGALCNAGLLALGAGVSSLFAVEGVIVAAAGIAASFGVLRDQRNLPST